MRRPSLSPDEVFAPTIRRIFQMCVGGMGAKEIVKTLNGEGLRTTSGKSWNKNNVYYILKNEVYTGTLVWNRQNKSQGRPRTPRRSSELRTTILPLLTGGHF